MNSLIVYEFKKIITRKSTYITALIVFLLLIAIYCANVFQQQFADDQGNTVQGFAAIAQHKQDAEALAGPLTDERLTQEFRDYRAFFKAEDELKDQYSSAADPTREFFDYDNRHIYFMMTFLEPWMVGFESPNTVIWRVDTESHIDYQTVVSESFERKLDQGMNDTWTYSPAERAFWQTHHDAVVQPFVYGYHGGWEAILDCIDFLMFVLIAICVGVTPVFASEYREKTDAVILSSRYGKSKLIGAKVLASFLFAGAMMLIGLLIAIGLPLLFYGTEGGDLPVQLMGLSIPYALTLSQAVAICAGIALLVAVGLAAFILFLSAKWRSTIGIMMAGIALVVLPLFLPFMGNGVVVHGSVLLPSMALSFVNLFRMMISYPIGSFVIDARIMIVVFYLIVIAVFIPLAMRAFRRHQVS